MTVAALLLAAMLAWEDPPKDVIEFFRSVAAALGDAHEDGNAGAFLDHFDKSMPGYVEFADRIESMTGAGDVSTSIDFVNIDGDDRKRTIELDWLLQCEGERARRALITCTVEKRGKSWKITAIAPIAFFRRE